jgi:hypothetical protein
MWIAFVPVSLPGPSILRTRRAGVVILFTSSRLRCLRLTFHHLYILAGGGA